MSFLHDIASFVSDIQGSVDEIKETALDATSGVTDAVETVRADIVEPLTDPFNQE